MTLRDTFDSDSAYGKDIISLWGSDRLDEHQLPQSRPDHTTMPLVNSVPRLVLGSIERSGILLNSQEIMTSDGLQEAGAIQAGDQIITRDGGYSKVVGVISFCAEAESSRDLVHIEAGRFTNSRSVTVTDDQLIRCDREWRGRLPSKRMVFAPAYSLVDGETVVRERAPTGTEFVRLVLSKPNQIIYVADAMGMTP